MEKNISSFLRLFKGPFFQKYTKVAFLCIPHHLKPGLFKANSNKITLQSTPTPNHLHIIKPDDKMTYYDATRKVPVPPYHWKV